MALRARIDASGPARSDRASFPVVRICVVYDCLFPYTVGGAERWYRNLAERLAEEGHEVTYLTLRQWDRGERPEVRACGWCAGPRMALYTAGGRRRILPPLVFGAGVLWHLLRARRRYDVVHSASFPYFSLLAAGRRARSRRYRLVVDWLEVWTREYWREYLGRLGGGDRRRRPAPVRGVPQRAFCFSRLHAARLREEGLRGEVTVLRGRVRRAARAAAAAGAAGRRVRRPAHPREARRWRSPRVAAEAGASGLRGVIFGDGPERAAVRDAIAGWACGAVVAPGFVAAERVDARRSRGALPAARPRAARATGWWSSRRRRAARRASSSPARTTRPSS